MCTGVNDERSLIKAAAKKKARSSTDTFYEAIMPKTRIDQKWNVLGDVPLSNHKISCLGRSSAIHYMGKMIWPVAFPLSQCNGLEEGSWAGPLPHQSLIVDPEVSPLFPGCGGSASPRTFFLYSDHNTEHFTSIGAIALSVTFEVSRGRKTCLGKYEATTFYVWLYSVFIVAWERTATLKPPSASKPLLFTVMFRLPWNQSRWSPINFWICTTFSLSF